MFVKQLTVFIENRVGTLEEVTESLKDHNINIFSISLADTSEYGLLRMIVSNPIEGKKVLQENGFSAMLTDVIAVRLENRVGTLSSLFRIISAAGIGIEYMYAMATAKTGAMILKTSEPDKTVQTLQDARMMLLDENTMYHLQ